MGFSESFFAATFGITARRSGAYLAEALSRGGDYADLYFEYLATSTISIDESIVKSATQGVSLGVGVRVIAGERTGYAYSDDLEPRKDPQSRAGGRLHRRRVPRKSRRRRCRRAAPQSVPGADRAQRNRLHRARRTW